MIARIVMLALLLAGAACAQPAPLILDHAMLTSLARTKEPDVQIGYTPERVELRTRRSILIGWMDVLLTARFERSANGHIQLVAQSLRAGPLPQTGMRFEQAREGLRKLVDVETDAKQVTIYKAGKIVYTQEVP